MKLSCENKNGEDVLSSIYIQVCLYIVTDAVD